MAGTDATQTPALGGPAIILVEPQLGENIGTAARAMLNCGLTDLRLVRPRDGWPNIKAERAAAGADLVLNGVRLFDRTEAAIADLGQVFATTARPRDMVKPVLTPREAAAAMRRAPAPFGVLFGRERTGLDNDDVALADTIIAVPLNPAFSSLNLAQAVLVIGYEWYQAGLAPDEGPPALPPPTPGSVAEALRQPASKAELVGFFEHLEQELDAAGFFLVADKRPSMVRNLRNLFHRAAPTAQEVRTLHGVVTALSGRRKDGRPRRG